MKRFLHYFLHEASVETDMVVGTLLTLLGFVLAIVLSFKSSTIFVVLGVLLMLFGLFMYIRSIYKIVR